MKYIPNLLSFSRLPLAVLIILLTIKTFYLTAFFIAILSALTDLWDGQFARKFKLDSNFGSILDPIMDKSYLLVLTCFLFFYYKTSNQVLDYLLFAWFAIAGARNILQLLAVPILALLEIKFKVKIKAFAKWGTALNMLVLATIFWNLAASQLQNVLFIDYLGPIALLSVIIPSFIFETWILITFLSRFIKILLRKHDTFV